MTTPPGCCLAIDLGTSGLKVGLVALDGSLVDVRQSEIHTHLGDHGEASQDAAGWWATIAAHVRSLLEHVDPASIDVVAVSGQYASVIPVDEEVQPTAECVLWMDARGGARVRKLIGGPVAGYRPGAVASFVRRTGGAPSPSGADGAGSVLHLLNDRPDVIERTRWLLEPVDYLTARFTGSPTATHASMFGWWLTDNRALSTMAYDETLLKRLSIPHDLLPPLVAFGSIAGEVSETAAEATGLKAGIPVVAGIPDLHAAIAGTGTLSPTGPGHLALSTTSWISAPMTKKKTDVLHSIATMPGLDQDSYLIIDNHEIGAKALDWLAGALGVHSPIDYDALVSEASDASPGSGTVIFTPWLAGERSPVERHDARGGFHNLSITTTRPDLVRAVLEGVAFNSKWLLDYVERFAGRSLGPLRLIGGGAKSPLWCQIHADVLGTPVDQVADPQLAQLKGTALLAFRSLGRIDDDGIGDLVAIERRYEPDEHAVEQLAPLYAEFPGLMSSQSKMFRRLQRRR